MRLAAGRSVTAVGVGLLWMGLGWLPGAAYPAGPPAGVTGGFGEDTCVACHDSYELNAGRLAGLGDLIVSGVPAAYRPGQAYRVKVELTHTEARAAWGFQLSARLSASGAQAGELKPVDGTTRVLVDKGIQYIEHTNEGIFSNVFEFEWTAPTEAGSEVVLHVAGNAADGDGSSVGDYIYAKSITISPEPR
jgi:hypothetical protein